MVAYSPPKLQHCFAVRFLVKFIEETVESLRLMRSSFPIVFKNVCFLTNAVFAKTMCMDVRTLK